MNELVSVVMPNRNGAKFLEEAIDSVLNQDYPRVQVIVIDDGSTDDSLTILKQYHSRITLIQTNSVGAAAARNAGIRVASGEYIALLDSDDVWNKTKLKLQIKEMETFNLDLVYCAGQEFTVDTNAFGLIHKPKFSGDCYSHFKKFPTRSIIELGCSTAVFRSSLLRSSGLFDETFKGSAEDWDFFRRYCKFAEVGFCNENLVRYRRHVGSITARPILDYYNGNKKAVLKMLAEDKKIALFERRLIWAKFQFISSKGFLKHGEVISGIRALFKILSPIK
jgi:glycosyltransferase involved in cell wall biosynthesis